MNIAPETERLLVDLAEAADGKCHLPVVTADGAAAVYGVLHAQIDRGTEARAAAAAAAGRPVACARGCAACCTNVPVVFAGEAVTIARWLGDPANAEAAAHFRDRYPAWEAALRDSLARWKEAASAGDVAAAQEALSAAWRHQVMCAFNRDGACTIYAVRPAVCRSAHALDTPANCQPDATEPVASLRFPPLDDYLERMQPVVLALHAALQPDGGARPLCTAVHEALAAQSAATASSSG